MIIVERGENRPRIQVKDNKEIETPLGRLRVTVDIEKLRRRKDLVEKWRKLAWFLCANPQLILTKKAFHTYRYPFYFPASKFNRRIAEKSC